MGRAHNVDEPVGFWRVDNEALVLAVHGPVDWRGGGVGGVGRGLGLGVNDHAGVSDALSRACLLAASRRLLANPSAIRGEDRRRQARPLRGRGSLGKPHETFGEPDLPQHTVAADPAGLARGIEHDLGGFAEIILEVAVAFFLRRCGAGGGGGRGLRLRLGLRVLCYRVIFDRALWLLRRALECQRRVEDDKVG